MESRLFVCHVAGVTVTETVGQLMEYGVGNARIVRIVLIEDLLMQTERLAAAQAVITATVAETKPTMRGYPLEKSLFVDLRLVSVAMQRAPFVHGLRELVGREHVGEVERYGYGLTGLIGTERIFPSGLIGVIRAEIYAPVHLYRLQSLPIRSVALYLEAHILLIQMRVSHYLYLLAATGIGRNIFGSERKLNAQLLERHHLVDLQKFELLVVTVQLGPHHYVRQRTGAVEADLEIVFVIEGHLQRLVGVEQTFRTVEEHLGGLVVVEHVVGVFVVVILRSQMIREDIPCHRPIVVGRNFLFSATGQQQQTARQHPKSGKDRVFHYTSIMLLYLSMRLISSEKRFSLYKAAIPLFKKAQI